MTDWTDIVVDGMRLSPDEALRDLDRADCEDSLYTFLEYAWRYIDPSPFVPGWPLEAIAEHLQAVVDGDIRKLVINIPPRMGKQVADDTPVLTTKGWMRHGDLRVGDHVFSPSGKPVRVKAVSGKTPSNVRVEFFDGSVIYCHENHEWTLYNRSSRLWETVETRLFLEPRRGRWGKTGRTTKRTLSAGRALHQLPLVQPVQFPSASLPIDPYVLGVWLGDGSTGKACITHSPKDREHIDHIINLGFAPSAVWAHAQTGVLTTSFAYTGMKERLSTAGVLTRKHIPEVYQTASVQQRLQLLAGLIDTDGHVDRNGRCHFSNTNRALIDGVVSLVRSMGWRASVNENAPRKSSSGVQGTKTCWVVAFQPTEKLPTKLPRKQVKRFAPRRAIGLKSVKYHPCGKTGHCIEVDAEDGLYLVGRALIPTHNSTICSVAFPAWVWTQRHESPTSGASVPLLHASYALSLAMRDSVKCRRLIESPWYQSLWGKRFHLVGDQNTKGRFQNSARGERLITAVDARVTGEGGNIIVVDDPNAANEALSRAMIEACTEWWDGTMSTRLNDSRNGAFVVIQQRLGEQDLTGHILETDTGWTHLCLPMKYEPERSFTTLTDWKDPRDEAGELLWPERFNAAQVAELEKRLGPWKAAGQLQQRPEPAGGGIIKREWWEPWPDAAYPPMDFIVASVDTAYTTKTENDYSAMTVWGVFSGDVVAQNTKEIQRDGNVAETPQREYAQQTPKVMLMTAWQERLELHDLVKKIADTCKSMKVDKLLIEDKAAGHSVAQELRRMFGYEDFTVQLINPGAIDKMARLYSIQHLFAEGMVYAPDRSWSDMVITQTGTFPKARHDDLVDTVSMALRHMRDIGLLSRSAERLAEVQDSLRHRGGPPKALYDI